MINPSLTNAGPLVWLVGDDCEVDLVGVLVVLPPRVVRTRLVLNEN